MTRTRSVVRDFVKRLRRLTKRDRAADNPALLGTLPDIAIDPSAIVDAVEAGRAER